jgi:lysophospholipase L1-like esterase
MSDRPIRSASLTRSTLSPSPWQALPIWVFVSLATNGLLVAVMMLVALRNYSLASTATRLTTQPPLAAAQSSFTQEQISAAPPLLTKRPTSAPLATAPRSLFASLPSASSGIGPRHQLTYQQWLDLLQQEAKAVTEHAPSRLTILAGDSLSLWFPPDLLPSDRTWLNQGISGETSAGLLRRLDFFERSQPETIFVMIGINDLIRRVKDNTLLANQRQILKTLRKQHPKAEIVMQSILPHGGQQAMWEGRDRLRSVSNQHIRDLNQQLRSIAHQEGAHFLDLHPLFTDIKGDLRQDLSTDGLHLNSQGYWVWRTALELYSQIGLSDQS